MCRNTNEPFDSRFNNHEDSFIIINFVYEVNFFYRIDCCEIQKIQTERKSKPGRRFLGIAHPRKTLFLPEPDSISKVIDKIWEEWSMDNNDSPQEIISQNWQRILGPKLCNRCAPENWTEKVFYT